MALDFQEGEANGMTEHFNYELGDDAPKSKRSEDRLGHAPFADRVARVITSVDASNGYVIGIHGPWGSGKSTTLNFVAERIRDHNQVESASPVVHIDFRPWLITGRHDLIGTFLKVLTESLEEGRPKSRKWLRKSADWAKATGVAEAVAKVAMAASDPSGVIVSTIVGNAARRIASSVIGRPLRIPSLQKAHEDMKERLRSADKRILVTVDDIDRLEADEIRSIIQMVKSVGKLPNVVYLLCYDRGIVWRALDGTANRRGPSFAEKIVQQELELPAPRRTRLLTMLDAEIDFLVGATELSTRWERIVSDGIRRWIRSPRDVVRIANAVKFSWPALQGEIDPQDLLAMDGLRLFDADAFNWIRDNRSLILGEDRFMLPPDGAREAVVDRLTEVVPEDARAEVLDLVAVLFPQLAKFLLDEQVIWPVEDHGEVVRRRGIGSGAGYDSYFGLHPSVDAVSLIELNRLVSTTEAREMECVFRRYLNEKDSAGGSMIGSLLEELVVRFRGQHAAEPMQAMLDAIFAVGEEIIGTDTSRTGMFSVQPRAQNHLLIGLMLDAWGPAEAGARLIEAFRKTDSPAFLADTFVSRGRESGVFGPQSSEDTSRVSEADFAVLGEVFLEKIKKAVAEGTLADAPFYFDIVRSWSHLCGPDDPRRWLERGMKDDLAFMVKVCRGLVSYSIDEGERQYDMRDVRDEELYDLTPLNEAAKMHVEDERITNDERNLIATVVQRSTQLLEERQVGDEA